LLKHETKEALFRILMIKLFSKLEVVRMKKWFTLVSACLVFILSGCSFLNSAQETLDYTKEATAYLEEASQFANEAPQLIEQAINNNDAAAELLSTLQQMKTDIEAFNNLNPPEVIVDLHTQIMEQNDIIMDQINIYLDGLTNGVLDPALLEANELLQPIQELTSMIDQIQKLGGE
jgi:hypothetical protein